AGYQYSGQVAGYCYKALKDRPIKTIILIGPSHYESFKGVAVYPTGSWKTPLGLIRIDSSMAEDLINPEADVNPNPKVFKREHSLEVQVPFIQKVLPGAKIVPLLVSHPTRASFEYLKDALAKILAKRSDVVVVLSSDLSHYHPYDRAKEIDSATIDAIQRLSLEDLERLLSRGKAEMCGAYPALYVLGALRQAGATHGVLLDYKNTGDVVPQMKDRVVGYASVAFVRTSLTKEEKLTLLNLARQAIETYVREKKAIEPDIKDIRLRANGSSFVTIKTGGHHLRGCIGNLLPYLPLYKSVVQNAVSACSRDPRFPPMSVEELRDMEVEVTVLSPMEPVEDIDEIVIGKHGLYLLKGNHSGVLLPQVPVEFG
ncbi:MAG: AmmeMemoRadiSam system protein B, partial [Nitrospirae bacterium]